MYYQDVYVYYDAACSKDPSVRLIYDYTYQFIKGTFDVYPETFEEQSFNTQIDTAVSGAVLEDAPGYMYFELVSMPESGTVSLAQDGSFTYYPEKGFTGTVSFTYAYSEGLCESEPCTITIVIE